MLEIVALIFLTKKMGALAERKGLKSSTWKLYTVLCWFGAEIIGVILGFAIMGEENMLVAVLLGLLACAVGSYFILKAYLSKRPDVMDEEDINRIGVNDLYPEKPGRTTL